MVVYSCFFKLDKSNGTDDVVTLTPTVVAVGPLDENFLASPARTASDSVFMFWVDPSFVLNKHILLSGLSNSDGAIDTFARAATGHEGPVSTAPNWSG